MLPSAGLGNYPRLAHPLSQQHLPNGVVDLVRAGVGEVLALQVDPALGALRKPLGEVEGRRPTDEITAQGSESDAEVLVPAGLGPSNGQLVQRRDQRLGDIAYPILVKSLFSGRHPEVTLAALAASKKVVIAAWSLRPGSASTPLATS